MNTLVIEAPLCERCKTKLSLGGMQQFCSKCEPEKEPTSPCNKLYNLIKKP
jgi:hypothetical protein